MMNAIRQLSDARYVAGQHDSASVRPAATLLLRAVLAVVLAMCVWSGTAARADRGAEYLMVPSAAMGRDLPERVA